MADDEYVGYATSVVRSLTGNRWMWPPMRVVDRYPSPASGKLRLSSRPVMEVHSVIDAVTEEAVEYTETASNVLLIPRGSVCLLRRHEIDVDYTYGSEPKGTLARAIAILADEMKLADDNDGACRLPERVQDISREGVSWTLIDPQDFLTEGRVGVYEVDLAISAVGGVRARAGMFTATMPPGLRLSVEQQPIP